MFRRLLLACAAVSLMAQAPIITFDKTHQNLGRLSGERKAAVKYKVTNTGNATLNITQVRPGCGCTYTMLGKWSLAPGESTAIEATFDPKGMRGLVRKTVEVVSDDPKTPAAILSFEAEIIQEIMPSVESVYFYQAPRAAPTRSLVRYASGNGEGVQILEARSSAPFLSFQIRAEGKDQVLDVIFDGRKVPKAQQRGVETATVRFSNPRVNQLTLNIPWDLRPSILAQPPEVVFQDVAGKPLSQKLSLRQVDGHPFRLLSQRGSISGLVAETSGQKAATQDITVLLPATLKAGRYSELLTFTTDDPDQPEIGIRVVALLK